MFNDFIKRTKQVYVRLFEQFQYTKHMKFLLYKNCHYRGVGDAAQNAKLLESFSNELTVLSGQVPVVKRAKKAIAGFGS